jgi:GNAT superfamily N-acetyltransferase
MRKYAGEEDYSRIRQFLQDVLMANDLREYSWHPARLDYWRWHGSMNCGDPGPENILIWEKDGRIAAVLNPENRGHAFIQMHPDFCCSELYGEMLAVAEMELGAPNQEGRKRVVAWADSNDEMAHEILRHRGFQKVDAPESSGRQGRQDLDRDILEPVVPEGYIVRELAGLEELPSRSWCSWKAFHPNDPDEKYEGWLWYRNIQAAPFYKRDLDIVAVDTDGEIASFTTVWYDEMTGTAMFEPVGTHKEHQRNGLALACITEGLRRLRKLGCRRAFLEGFSEPAKALYHKAGFHDFDTAEPWRKFL